MPTVFQRLKYACQTSTDIYTVIILFMKCALNWKSMNHYARVLQVEIQKSKLKSIIMVNKNFHLSMTTLDCGEIILIKALF